MLAGWTGPASDTEQEKQERTERMVRDALASHASLKSCRYRVFAKGSYANNTNVRADSDVDIAVECQEAEYWDEARPGLRIPGPSYVGEWTPSKFRLEVTAALRTAMPGQVDGSGTTAIRVRPTTSRVAADIVPCFMYKLYVEGGVSIRGTRIFRTDGTTLVNYPEQHLEYGTAKNLRTGQAYKRVVRILKRTENALVERGLLRDVPSYFIECLAFNCPDDVYTGQTWTSITRQALQSVWNGLSGDEPVNAALRWREANRIKFLFEPGQKWTRETGRKFVQAAWNHLGFNS